MQTEIIEIIEIENIYDIFTKLQTDDIYHFFRLLRHELVEKNYTPFISLNPSKKQNVGTEDSSDPQDTCEKMVHSTLKLFTPDNMFIRKDLILNDGNVLKIIIFNNTEKSDDEVKEIQNFDEDTHLRIETITDMFEKIDHKYIDNFLVDLNNVLYFYYHLNPAPLVEYIDYYQDGKNDIILKFELDVDLETLCKEFPELKDSF